MVGTAKRYVLLPGILLASISWATALELFAKGTVSKSYLNKDSWTSNVSVSGGFGFTLFPAIRLEARYSNIATLQNIFNAVFSDGTTGILNDIKSETAVYSLGLDFDFFGDRSPVQPFLFVGAGYIETSRSYYGRRAASDAAVLYSEPKKTGISANLGLGIRIRIARALALEFEGYAYGIDVQKAHPLIDWNGLVGVRIFL